MKKNYQKPMPTRKGRLSAITANGSGSNTTI